MNSIVCDEDFNVPEGFKRLISFKICKIICFFLPKSIFMAVLRLMPTFKN
jgi:hypothetical protein